MSAIEKFEIQLEHDIDEQYQYEPDETLRGHVVLKLSEPTKLKAIQVQIKGEATVSWEDEGTANSQAFCADETYIDVTQTIVQPRPGADIIDLGPGMHEFPMEYQLPHNLPSSFIGKFGSITYVVKATLKENKKFGMSTMITSEPFLVLRKLDLSAKPTLLQKRELHGEESIWMCCFPGKAHVKLDINKSAFLPGEDIFMDAEITNSSHRIVKAVQAAIVMQSSFHAKNNTRKSIQYVNKKRDEWEMSYGEGRRWKNVRLTIPPYIPESKLDGCDIIDITYELLFCVEISGGYDIKMSLPLLVGTTHSIGLSDIPMNFPGSNPEENTNEGVPKMDEEEEANFRRPLPHGGVRVNPLNEAMANNNKNES